MYGNAHFKESAAFQGPLDENGYDDSNKSQEAWEQLEEALEAHTLDELMYYSLTI